MEFEELKDKIENQIDELAKSIEKFCVLENTTYTKSYKDELRKIHNLFEELDQT